jgi:hypothetical protein
MDKPQILTLNVQPEAIKKLKELNFNIYEGSLGKRVSLDYNNASYRNCSSNHIIPSNLHEYDIVIIDLSYIETIPYKEDNHISKSKISQNYLYFHCSRPQDIFDPRGLAAHILREKLEELINHNSLIIIFQGEQIEFDYHFSGVLKGRGVEKNEQHKLYDFSPIIIPINKNKSGKETKVVCQGTKLFDILERYNTEFNYNITFWHPEIYKENEGYVKDPKFGSLITNKDNDVVSFGCIAEKTKMFVFPQLKDYSTFLSEFLNNIAPSFAPDLFPNSTEKLWLKESTYALPNQLRLEEERKSLKENWEKQDAEKEQQIEQNYKGFEFLHKILTESGDELVEATITYLKWLGFDNPKNMDDEKVEGQNNEEDIQIENDKGLLVIEVKGIGGTSKDNECSQISKIKYRRAKERSRFDVSGLYIVNHQRYLPPLSRQNPPFQPQQIEDAESEERGLLTTFQLFNLYFDIENGIISKEEARESLYNYGLVQFRPSNLIYVGEAEKIYQSGSIISTTINYVSIKVEQQLYIENDNRFQLANIAEIQKDKEALQNVSDGKVGIKVDVKAKEGAKIWLKK